MILGVCFEAESRAKFFFGLGELLRVHQRSAEIVVAKTGFGIERNRLA